MHAQPSKDGRQFADLSKPLEQDVELRLLPLPLQNKKT
jgi:hypothetical protein